MIEKYSLFYLLALIAEILGTVSGFGSSILFVPIAAAFFDFHTVLGITAVFHVFSNLSKIALFRNGIDRNIAIKLGIPAVIAVIIGASLTAIIPTGSLELLMNFVLILMAIYLIINFNKQVAKTDTNLFIGGFSSGFFAGLLGTGGALRGITLAAFNLPKDIFIATSALIDLGVDSSRAAVYAYNGYIHADSFWLIAGLVIVSIVGSFVGKKLLQYTSEKTFRYIVLIVIILSAVYQSYHYFSK